MMPDMDGYAVAARIKGNIATKAIPIIMVTVRDDREAKMRGLRAGAEDFLSKPVDRAELCVRVKNLLRLKAYGDYFDKYGQLLEDEVGSRTADLVESELRFRRLFESGIVGVTVTARSGVLTEANATFLDLLGYSREDLEAGKLNWRELTPPDLREAPVLVQDLEKRGSGVSWEKEYLRKDGTRVPVLVGVAALDDDRNITVVTDLTERKRAEERKAAVVNAALDAVVVMDAEGRITEFNPAAERMFGYSSAAVLGRALAAAIIPLRFRDAHEQGLKHYLKTGEGPIIGARHELWAVRSDGVEFPVEFSVSRVGSGMAPTFVGFIRDITERKRVEQNLLERMQIAALGADVGAALTTGDALPEILQRCAQAIVIHLDAAIARIWTFNATSKLLDLQASVGLRTDVDGTDPRAPKFDVARVALERLPHVSNDLQNDPYVIDPAWARREGLLAFAGYPLIVDGELVGAVVTLAREPLTEVALKGLAATADTIAVRIRGKLAEQANKGLEEQLRQSQKMEAVGRLAGGVAHDFNNLLSVVLSYAEFAIADLHASDPIRCDIEQIRRAGLRAADLTRQLLMFSRQQVVEPKVLDLNDVLSGMDKMLRRIVGEDVTFTALLAESLGRVRVDPGSIEQVIMNLVINARDAMATGGKITMETANVVLDEQFATSHLGAIAGPHVMVSVTDTGTGMDKATLARIFEPFFTTKEKGKGTGLGLSTVFGIAQQSGGTVWVYSEPGIGTTFKLYLPRVNAMAEAPRTPRDALSGRGTETVLLVEDEDQVRDVARGILRRYGYTVLEARNGGEALLHCERHTATIDLLLSDVVMPGMSGPELAKRLAQARPDMKVLCMSGYTDDTAVRHGVIDAHFAYLQKPLTVETLTRKVREVLDAKGARPLDASAEVDAQRSS